MTFKSLLAVAFTLLAVAFAQDDFTPFPGCSGSATYNVTFINRVTARRFGDIPNLPENGLVFSPLAGASHSNRFSFFTIRGFANRAVEDIAELGDNTRFLRLAERIRRQRGEVLSIDSADGPTFAGQRTTLTLTVDCQHPFMTVLSMLAPSPDWIVQINNLNMFDSSRGRFLRQRRMNLITYDAGTDDGGDFTPPPATELDIPTVPQQNIAPLVEDATDVFQNRFTARVVIVRID